MRVIVIDSSGNFGPYTERMVFSAKGGGARGTQQLREQNLERLTITRNLDHGAESYNGRRGKDNTILADGPSRASWHMGRICGGSMVSPSRYRRVTDGNRTRQSELRGMHRRLSMYHHSSGNDRGGGDLLSMPRGRRRIEEGVGVMPAMLAACPAPAPL